MRKTLAVFSVSILSIAVATASLAGASPKRILIYGDSNAFGWAKDAQGTVYRLPSDVRWPEKMGACSAKTTKSSSKP